MIATDDGVPSLSSMVNVTVTVEDFNNHAPNITNLPTKVKVEEAIGPGIEIYKILATDNDIGSNSKLSFHIIAGKYEIRINIL